MSIVLGSSFGNWAFNTKLFLLLPLKTLDELEWKSNNIIFKLPFHSKLNSNLIPNMKQYLKPFFQIFRKISA